MNLPLSDLVTAFTTANYTPQQKALMAAVAGLFSLRFIFYSEILPVLWRCSKSVATGAVNILRGKRQKGVKLGRIFLSDSERVRHCHIVGSPGSGKTEATKSLIFEDLKAGRGCFIVDAKGDRELYEEVKGFCRSIGRESDLKLLSATFPDESVRWNPCALGNASELQSKFLNSNIYSESFYAKACEHTLLKAFNQLLAESAETIQLTDLVQKLQGIGSQDKNEHTAALFYDFGSLCESEWGAVLLPSREHETVELLEMVQRNQILFVHLPTEGKSVQSSRIGRLLTQELILISGLKKCFPELNCSGQFSVYIDEFDAFATDSFVTFLNKGRSSNFMIHIAHQTLSDLKKIGPAFAGQILGNCNIHLIFRQDDPDDSELWARFIGTQKTVKRTYQAQDGMHTGATSNRDVQEFIIGPDVIKNLKVGECIISVKTAGVHKRLKLPLPKKYRTVAQLRSKGTRPILSPTRSVKPQTPSNTITETEKSFFTKIVVETSEEKRV